MRASYCLPVAGQPHDPQQLVAKIDKSLPAETLGQNLLMLAHNRRRLFEEGDQLGCRSSRRRRSTSSRARRPASFYPVRELRVRLIRSDRNLLTTEQLPADRITTLARAQSVAAGEA